MALVKVEQRLMFNTFLEIENSNPGFACFLPVMQVISCCIVSFVCVLGGEGLQFRKKKNGTGILEEDCIYVHWQHKIIFAVSTQLKFWSSKDYKANFVKAFQTD